jgi:hypothetical protein
MRPASATPAEPREQRLVIILADLSGYTKFMVENQLSAVHGQLCITYLIETILREVDIPLQLQEIEGDAVFLYAAHPGDDDEWREVLAQVRTKLLRFFEAFYAGSITASESTPCKCAICRNVDDLKLKVIVHSGSAVFHSIGGSPQVSGTDVILAHRLLKNSVPGEEYLLMTGPAYRDLGREMDGEFVEGHERYDELGSVETFVRYIGEVKERQREALYSLSRTSLALRAQRYVVVATLGQFLGIYQQIRNPTLEVGGLRRAAFIAASALLAPFVLLVGLFAIPRKLMSQQAARAQAGQREGAGAGAG